MKINWWLPALVVVLAPDFLLAAKPSSLELLFGTQEVMDKLTGVSSESLSGRSNEVREQWASQHEWYSRSDSDRWARSQWRSLGAESTLPPGLRKSGKSRRSWTSD
jgi:hypothetical protein